MLRTRISRLKIRLSLDKRNREKDKSTGVRPSCSIIKKYVYLAIDVLERKTGFEPAVSALARQRSTTEPLPQITYSIGADKGT